MKAGGATLGVKPFVRMKSAGAALRLFACLAALCISVIAIAPSESFAAPMFKRPVYAPIESACFTVNPETAKI